MDLFRLKLIRILYNVNTSLLKDKRLWMILDNDCLIEYIFEHLNHGDATSFYLHLKNIFANTYLELLKSHFMVVIKKIDFPDYYILECYEKFGTSFILEHLEDIGKSLNLFAYRDVMISLNNREVYIKKRLEQLNPILYQYYDAIKNSKKDSFCNFDYSIFFPLLQVHAEEYLKSLQKPLFLNKPLEIEYLKRGSSSFVFDVNGKIVKFATVHKVFPIYMHYRMNEFYVRKKIPLKTGHILIEICPKGNLKMVEQKDIEDALADLKHARLILTDKNYAQNFAYFEEEADLYFRDVDGIIEYREEKFSESYQKRKVKLIDHEYVYDEDDTNKCWIIP